MQTFKNAKELLIDAVAKARVYIAKEKARRAEQEAHAFASHERKNLYNWSADFEKRIDDQQVRLAKRQRR